jgi:hypothetical protein
MWNAADNLRRRNVYTECHQQTRVHPDALTRTVSIVHDATAELGMLPNIHASLKTRRFSAFGGRRREVIQVR